MVVEIEIDRNSKKEAFNLHLNLLFLFNRSKYPYKSNGLRSGNSRDHSLLVFLDIQENFLLVMKIDTNNIT